MHVQPYSGLGLNKPGNIRHCFNCFLGATYQDTGAICTSLPVTDGSDRWKITFVNPGNPNDANRITIQTLDPNVSSDNGGRRVYLARGQHQNPGGSINTVIMSSQPVEWNYAMSTDACRLRIYRPDNMEPLMWCGSWCNNWWLGADFDPSQNPNARNNGGHWVLTTQVHLNEVAGSANLYLRNDYLMIQIG